MKINRATLPLKKDVTIEETIDFSVYPFDEHHIRRVDHCEVKVVLHEFEDVLSCKLTGFANVIAACSYTLEDVPLKVKFKEDFFFSDEKNFLDKTDYEPNNIIDLDPYIIALICAAVPHNLVKPGASLPRSGKGYRVLTEEQYFSEKSKKRNTSFDILDTLITEEKEK